MSDLILDLLLPPTDEAVTIQFILWAVTFPVALATAWRRGHEARLFVIGIWLFTASFFGLRALH